ncbi:hypothetical protein [Anaeroselena agilis]|uniref:Uncharacterized protein n=1 Tax=Anaeroselena agilis TaxID=3063788 RepID=A0ABU3NXQ5_9FIRM|nr:hypothetical protein [Selenomonadales bacterium 4137-cl]
MADSETELWRIEARAFRVPLVPFTHNFWALVDAGGAVVEQLHGLAVDPRTGKAKAIGWSAHLLLAVRGAGFLWALQPGQPTAVCARGREAEVMPRWLAAAAAIPAMNALGLRYPNLWQHGLRANSNSVFSTFGLIMGFDAPARLLPTLAPGVKLVVSRELVERYRFRPPSTG